VVAPSNSLQINSNTLANYNLPLSNIKIVSDIKWLNGVTDKKSRAVE